MVACKQEKLYGVRDRTFIKIDVKVYENRKCVLCCNCSHRLGEEKNGLKLSLRCFHDLYSRKYYDLPARALQAVMEIEIFMARVKDLLMKLNNSQRDSALQSQKNL